MCLQIINKRYVFARRTQFTAWKKFGYWEPSGNTERVLCSPIHQDYTYHLGWNKAEGFMDEHGFFRTGFYCLADSQYQHQYSYDSAPIFPVTVRGLVARGRNIGESSEVLIVRELFIPENWQELVLHREEM